MANQQDISGPTEHKASSEQTQPRSSQDKHPSRQKRALVLGISGNFGAAMASALHQKGWQVSALLRDSTKAPDWLAAEHCHQGSVQDEDLLSELAQKVDLIVYGINPPYPLWSEQALAMLEPSVRVAERFGLRLLFPGNVYGFAPSGTLIHEDTQMQPPTEKGRIRVAMEARLKQASEQGAKVLIVRAGDFIAARRASTEMQKDTSWFSQIVRFRSGRVSLQLPHNSQHPHYWSYLPDLCANTASLLDQESPQQALPDWLVLHDPGLVLTKADWLEACHQLGLPVRVKAFPWWLISLLGLFNPMLREVNRMRYLWQQPVIADGQRFQGRLGNDFQATPFPQILAQRLGISYP